MRLFVCEHDDCGVILFSESDAGSARCPSCGFLGGLARTTDADRGGVRRLVAALFGRPTRPAVPV